MAKVGMQNELVKENFSFKKNKVKDNCLKVKRLNKDSFCPKEKIIYIKKKSFFRDGFKEFKKELFLLREALLKTHKIIFLSIGHLNFKWLLLNVCCIFLFFLEFVI